MIANLRPTFRSTTALRRQIQQRLRHKSMDSLPPRPPPPPSRPTADVCDHFYEHIIRGEGGNVHVLSPVPQFHIFGAHRCFSGPVTTLKIFEDNSLLRLALEEPGNGRVLVVDGGGSLRCALLGGNLAQMASINGWRGLVVNGCVRDVEEINETLIGVRALGSNPLKSFKRQQGERNVPVNISGVRIRPGDWCYSDADGIVVADSSLPALY